MTLQPLGLVGLRTISTVRRCVCKASGAAPLLLRRSQVCGRAAPSRRARPGSRRASPASMTSGSSSIDRGDAAGGEPAQHVELVDAAPGGSRRPGACAVRRRAGRAARASRAVTSRSHSGRPVSQTISCSRARSATSAGALGQQRVGVRLGEESVPAMPVQVMQPVPDVGDDAVDVEDREHTRHPSSRTGRITVLVRFLDPAPQFELTYDDVFMVPARSDGGVPLRRRPDHLRRQRRDDPDRRREHDRGRRAPDGRDRRAPRRADRAAAGHPGRRSCARSSAGSRRGTSSSTPR